MKCQQLINQVRKDLNDPKEVTWKQDDLEAVLADALLALSLVRPDATAVTQSIPLVPGTKQTLPAGSLRAIRFIRNMGSGATPGKALRVGDRETLDVMFPEWHEEVGTEVHEVFYDPLIPNEFYVYPGMSASGVFIEASIQRVPTAISNPESEDLPVADIYAPALHEWMLYRAWGGDDESSPNYPVARDRRANFFQLLGVKSQADIAVSAKPSSSIK